MRTRNLMKTTALALALLANGISVNAQDSAEHQTQVELRRGIERGLEVIVQGQEGAAHLPPPPPVAIGGGRGDTFVYVSTEMSFEGRVVKGAPYSAQAVTEMIQTLADGNRIVRKNTANIYRDNEGRTRRDQTLGSIGPYAAAGDPPQTFFINDPVSGVNYILDPRTKTARKLNFHFRVLKPTEAPGQLKPSTAPAQSKAPAAPSAESKPRVNSYTFNTAIAPTPMNGPDHVFFYSGAPGEPKKESLGKQTVEGVEAEGTRTTMTIPAGTIGNEQPINVVSERWYSNELQTVVMTRHSDPRHGETIYRLTNINRSEPSRALFEVPSDYTVKEMPSVQPLRRRMPAPPSPNDL